MAELSPAAAWRPTQEQLNREYPLLLSDLHRFSGPGGDLGELRYFQRDWPPRWWLWPAIPILLLWLFMTPNSLASNTFAYCFTVTLGYGVIALGWCNKTWVYDHAIVIRSTPVRWFTKVIPLATIDYSRLRIHQPFFFAGPRTGSYSSTYHLAFANTTVVAFEGLANRLTTCKSPRWFWLRTDGPLPWERYLNIDADPRDNFATPDTYPTAFWAIASRRPHALVQAIEDALTASGRTSATGLTERVLASIVVERWRNTLTDTNIYGTRHDAGTSALPWFKPAHTPRPNILGIRNLEPEAQQPDQ